VYDKVLKKTSRGTQIGTHADGVRKKNNRLLWSSAPVKPKRTSVKKLSLNGDFQQEKKKGTNGRLRRARNATEMSGAIEKGWGGGFGKHRDS